MAVESSPGASVVWTDPAFAPWRALIEAGDFAAAEAAVAGDRSAAAAEARETLRRLRHQWSLDADAMFAKLVDQIPDATREDFAAWTASGKIESKVIDGERRYFRREPRNLILFDAAARARHEKAKGKPSTGDRHDSTAPIIPHLADVVRASEASPGARELLPVKTRFHYTLTVKPNRPGVKAGSIVRAWLPFPQMYGRQRDIRLLSASPANPVIAPEAAPQRTAYFEQTVADPTKPTIFTLSFEYTTAASMWRALPTRDPSPVESLCYLEARPPHIVFTDEVKRIVAELSADSPDKATLAKRIWNWVDDAIPWRAEHEYCLIPSIVEQSLRLRRGDCGVAAITLITLCRAAGIPARWQSGWTTDPASGGNMHDWAEVFLDGYGWIPVDASYGKKQHADERVRDFYFGGLDRYRLIVNTDFGQPLVPPTTALRAEPLDFQRGEVEIDGRNLYFDEWDYSFKFEHEDR